MNCNATFVLRVHLLERGKRCMANVSHQGSTGFSLVEALLAISVLTIGMLAMGEHMVTMQVQMKRSDLKSQSMTQWEQLRLSLLSRESCERTFMTSQNVTEGDGQLVNLPTAESLHSSSIQSLQRLQLGTHELRRGQPWGELNVKTIELWFERPLSNGGYLASLSLELERRTVPSSASADSAPRTVASSLEGLSFKRSFPLYLNVQELPSDGGTRHRVRSCWMMQESDPRTSCTEMGGKWLYYPPPADSNSVRFRDRCIFDASIQLAESELPVNTITGDVNVDEQRFRDGHLTDEDLAQKVTECYYQAQGQHQVNTYRCVGYTNIVSGWRCSYDQSRRSWGVHYFLANAQRTQGDWQRTGGVVRRYIACNKGVRLSRSAQTTQILQYHQPLQEAFAPQATQNLSPAHLKLWTLDRINTVRRCKYNHLLDQWLECNNSSNAALALEGKAGSCIYIKGGNAMYGNHVAAFNLANGCPANYINLRAVPPGLPPETPECISVQNYTGWIRVEAERQPVQSFTVGGGPNAVTTSVTREARGYPCLGGVEVDTQMGGSIDTVPQRSPLSSAPFLEQNPPSLMQSDSNFIAPTSVSHCFSAPQAAWELSSNMLRPPLPNHSATPSDRLTVFSCNNADLLPEHFLPRANQAPLAFASAGRCWWVNGFRLDHFATGRSQPLYTGWVYVRSPLSSNLFTGTNPWVVADANTGILSMRMANNSPMVSGVIPCRSMHSPDNAELSGVKVDPTVMGPQPP